MKLSTINQIVEWILAEGEAEINENNLGQNDRLEYMKRFQRIANEATIYLKTAMLCESNGIDKAMEYFTGTHTEDEFQEFRTGVIENEI